MKKYIILIAFFILAYTTSKGTATHMLATLKTGSKIAHVRSVESNKLSDTARFIRDNIIAHPEKFEHQPLGKILDILPFKIRSYSFGFGHKIGTIKNLVLYLNNEQTIAISFYFEKPIEALPAERIEIKSKGEWLDAENHFYRNQIIRDIHY